MKLIELTGVYKTLTALFALLIVLFIYYQNSLKCFDQYNHLVNATTEVKVTASLAHRDILIEKTAAAKRLKRFLMFQGGGVVKLVLGTSFPIMMADKKRSLNYFYNFQMQYAPPNIPLYWWSIYNTTTFAARKKARKRSIETLRHYDKSRILVYEFMETILERSGTGSKKCLLKLICDLASTPLIEDLENQIMEDYGRNIYHRLLNAIFSPLLPNVNERYLMARAAGQNGANCVKTFGECPLIDELLQRFTKFI